MYFLLFNGLIAQTLQFTLDAVRGIQIFEIDAEIKNPCAIEQLGLTQAIVFDKTGTLTQNKLEPQILSIMHDRNYQIHDKTRGCSCVINRHEWSKGLKQLLLAICLNNSVMRGQSGRVERANPNYFGTSADEVALLESVFHSFGYYIVSRTVGKEGEILTLHTDPDDQADCPDTAWHILYVYKYTSERGMMTVMVRNKDTGEVFFYSKGSPERMYSYLRAEDREEAQQRVEELAGQGLRVLLYAMVKLDWEAVEEQFYAAHATQDDDSLAIQAFRRDYLRDMVAIGVTGTEDQLQPRLRQTIKKIQAGNIICLMCTGDIKLTAENIGKNCRILPSAPGSKVFDIQDHPDFSLEEQLEAARAFPLPKGLLEGKDQLAKILNDKSLSKLFFELVTTCAGVVTYRAHPKLKAQLTRFLMKNGLLTCSVGDGANDIDMIKQANVGVGIKDGENSHAAGSSDLAIHHVGQLPKLIFYYGKQNWERNTKMTHLITCMKMTVVVALLLHDALYTNFAAKSLFTGRMLLAYNFFYGWATAVYGIVHQSFPSPADALRRPARFLSRPEFRLDALSLSRSALWWLKAAIDAAACLLITMWWWNPAATLSGSSSSPSPSPSPSPSTWDSACPQDGWDVMQAPSAASYHSHSSVHSNWLVGANGGYFLFGEDVPVAHVACFVVIMMWVNLRVSLETRQLKVHAAVVGTLLPFLAVTLIPIWGELPPYFVSFLVGMCLFFFAYNYLFDAALAFVHRHLLSFFLFFFSSHSTTTTASSTSSTLHDTTTTSQPFIGQPKEAWAQALSEGTGMASPATPSRFGSGSGRTTSLRSSHRTLTESTAALMPNHHQLHNQTHHNQESDTEHDSLRSSSESTMVGELDPSLPQIDLSKSGSGARPSLLPSSQISSPKAPPHRHAHAPASPTDLEGKGKAKANVDDKTNDE